MLLYEFVGHWEELRKYNLMYIFLFEEKVWLQKFYEESNIVHVC